MKVQFTLVLCLWLITSAKTQNIGIGTNNPETTLHVKSSITPTIKLQADGSSEESGRISMRRDNEKGIDLYYDGSKAEGLMIFESYNGQFTTGKILTLNESTRTLKLGTTTTITNPSETLVVAADGTIGTKQKYQIGDAAHGGVIFWLDETGDHGLVVAVDEFTGPWTDDLTANVVYANSDGIKGGDRNTTLIIIGANGDPNAGLTCSSYQSGNYGDWYLPSQFELNQMYTQFNSGLLGPTGLDNIEYWSSSEVNSQQAIVIDFGGGSAFPHNKADGSISIRPVRAF